MAKDVYVYMHRVLWYRGEEYYEYVMYKTHHVEFSSLLRYYMHWGGQAGKPYVSSKVPLALGADERITGYLKNTETCKNVHPEIIIKMLKK